MIRALLAVSRFTRGDVHGGERMIRALLRRLFRCRHKHTYLERRELNGLGIMHYVCDSCSHAEPVIDRTPEEYRANAAKQVPLPKAQKKEIQIPSASERARALQAIRSTVPFRRAK